MGGVGGGGGVQIGQSHLAAAHGHQGRGGEAEFLGAQHTGDRHVPPGHQLAVGLDDHLGSQAVFDEGLVGLRHAQLPGQARTHDGVPGGRAGAAVVAGDEHHLGACLGDAGGNADDA